MTKTAMSCLTHLNHSMAKQPSPSFDFTELLHIDIQKSQDCQFNDQNGHAMFNLLVIILIGKKSSNI